MSGEKTPWQEWLSQAVSGIRFAPDREEVRRELLDHLEDKAADLERIFPDMTRREAEEMALAQMGEADVLGKELARIHKPWLGYLWRASRVLLGLALVVLTVELLAALGVAWDLVWPEIDKLLAGLLPG